MIKTCQLIVFMFVFSFKLLSVQAQISFQQSRSADTIIYYVNNPNGQNAEFTWTITGGIIVGHSSPYTAEAADSIQVIWNELNKNTANFGSLTVSKVVTWAAGSSCASSEERIDVESWNQPKASIDTSGLRICSGESFSILVEFEGKPDYKFKWKIYNKDDSGTILEDHTAEFSTSENSSTEIIVIGIENYSGSEKMYELEITDVQDGLSDAMPGNLSTASVTIYIQAKASAGILKTNKNLIRR